MVLNIKYNKKELNNPGTLKQNVLYVLDEDGFFLDAKGATEEICGYSSFELMGKSIAQLLPMIEIPRNSQYINRVLKGETLVYHTRLVHKNSQKVEIKLKAIPLKKQGKVIAIYGIVKHLKMRKKQ